MILQKNGNLLDAPEDIIVHQVNCMGRMSSGIALQIRNKWPKVYDQYISLFMNTSSNKLLGEVQFIKVKHDKWVANLFGQYYYGYSGERFTNYEAIYNGLEKIKKVAKRNNKSIAIPYNMGCDRGGANWEIVCKMIEQVFNDYKVTIYKYNGGK